MKNSEIIFEIKQTISKLQALLSKIESKESTDDLGVAEQSYMPNDWNKGEKQ